MKKLLVTVLAVLLIFLIIVLFIGFVVLGLIRIFIGVFTLAVS